MKKKVIALGIVASMLFGGAVSAATTSLWGKYKGNDIVRVQYNGTTVSYKDVPAISYNGRVMIPVTMLSSVGVSYTWDQVNKTIKLNSNGAYSPPAAVQKPSTPTTPQINASTKIDPSDLKLYSNDGKVFLGTLSPNFYDSDSIFNEYGNYGSEYSSTSITNKFGTYGSEFSNESAYNQYATNPPILTYKGTTVFYVTTNKYLKNAIAPQQLYDLATSL